MAKKLFVGNLSWNTRDEGLYEAFSQFGEVSEAKVILDRETGRSRGFGFVTFATDEAGDDAISGMDGQDLDGRTIRVNVALSIGIKIIFLILVLAGLGTMWMAVLADMGTSVLVTLNGMRLLNKKPLDAAPPPGQPQTSHM